LGTGVLALVLVGTAAGGAGGADAVLEGSSRTQLTCLLLVPHVGGHAIEGTTGAATTRRGGDSSDLTWWL
jgi:hypothetical protein